MALKKIACRNCVTVTERVKMSGNNYVMVYRIVNFHKMQICTSETANNYAKQGCLLYVSDVYEYNYIITTDVRELFVLIQRAIHFVKS